MREYQRDDGTRWGVTTVHGESYSLFHVVQIDAPEEDQPAIVASYKTFGQAENHAQGKNG